MDTTYYERLAAERMAASQPRDTYWVSVESPGVVVQLPDVTPPSLEGPVESAGRLY